MDGVRINRGDKIIEGAKVIVLRRHLDQPGAVYHMLKAREPHCGMRGEINRSAVDPGVVKA